MENEDILKSNIVRHARHLSPLLESPSNCLRPFDLSNVNACSRETLPDMPDSHKVDLRRLIGGLVSDGEILRPSQQQDGATCSVSVCIRRDATPIALHTHSHSLIAL